MTMMTLSSIRGRSAAALLLCSNLVVACGDDGDGDTTNAESTSASASDTDPTSATDPAESSSGDPTGVESSGVAESSSDDGADEASTSSASTEATESGDTTAGDTTGAEGLEIIGSYADGFGGEHQITDTDWTQLYGDDAFVYAIDSYDNAEGVVIAEDTGTDTWSKFEWTYVESDLYYCQSAFGEASADDAAAAPDADPADPANGGCGTFAWSLLTPLR